MVVDPKKAMIIGGDWRLPMYEGLLDKNFVRELKADGSFNEATFDREYNSNWEGAVEDAFFLPDKIDKYRRLNLAEKQYNKKLQGNDHYVMGVDVGRFGLNVGSNKISLIAGTSLCITITRTISSQGRARFLCESRFND